MRLAAVCGSGLGSRFMVEMNIQTILKELSISGVDVQHYDVGSASPDLADVFFVGGDLADSTMHLGRVIVLNSIIDMDELREKVTAVVKEAGLM